MKLFHPRLLIGCVSAAAVVYFVIGDLGRTAPGPLSTVHGREAELAGPRSCNQCHGGWFSDMTDSCLECHEVIGEQVDQLSGLHGMLGADKAAMCSMCHSEHHGGGFDVVNAQSFALAGVPSVGEFDHQLVGFPMAGNHLELQCSECHEHAEMDVLPVGEFRYLGLDQDCATCHEDAHRGQMVLGCAQCHGQESFEQLDSLGHERHLPLIGGHGDLSCRECHDSDGAYSLESLGRGQPQPKRECTGCHESPHRASFVDGVARISSVTPAASCVVCHAAEHTSFGDGQPTATSQQHQRAGFALVAPHDELDCEQCHDPQQEYAGRYPGRSADDCHSCHDDPHAGQFAQRADAAEGCLACHQRDRFEPHTFDVDRHAATPLALTGSHLDADCNACHLTPTGSEVRTFSGVSDTCADCHDDAHRGAFDRFAAELTGVAHGACAQCHEPTTFSATLGEFDHERWTEFAVHGAHAQLDCEHCHERSEEPDASGRSFGRVTDHFGEFVGCQTCHTDPHAGGFDGADMPAEVDGRSSCLRCHTEVSFRSSAEHFDHGRWTGFDLTDRHAAISCSACHTPLRRPDGDGRTWTAARGRECADCHQDEHHRQFEVDGRTRCDRCHRSAAAFSDLSFRHNLDARFRLGEAHENVACAACHRTEGSAEHGFVRYRPMRRQCVDCHGQHSGPFRRRKGGR